MGRNFGIPSSRHLKMVGSGRCASLIRNGPNIVCRLSSIFVIYNLIGASYFITRANFFFFMGSIEKDSESVNQTPARALIHITYYESSWLGIQAKAKRHRIRQHNLRGCLSVLR